MSDKAKAILQSLIECVIVTLAALLVAFYFAMILGTLPLYFAYPYAMGVSVIFCWIPRISGRLALGFILPLILLQFPVYYLVLNRYHKEGKGRILVAVLLIAHLIVAFIGLFAGNKAGMH